jgi:hypothetical protein
LIFVVIGLRFVRERIMSTLHELQQRRHGASATGNNNPLPVAQASHFFFKCGVHD